MDKLAWQDVARVSRVCCACLALAASMTACKATTPDGSAQAPAGVTISGVPAGTVTAGTPYVFQPTAASAAHGTISFSVQNKPAWAALSTVTGRLSGTPATADTGSYPNIIISVSDGTATARLTPFTITVATPATPTNGSATLAWTPPKQNMDGTALTNLAGFHIYYGKNPNTLDQMISVGNPASTAYTVANLPRGTWYFAVTAYTADKVESELSPVVNKSI